MKSFVLWTAMFVAQVAFSAEPAVPFPEYDGPRAKYLETIEKARGLKEPKLIPLNRTYAERLEALRKSTETSGDKAGAAAVMAEQERLKKGLDPTPAERGAMPGLLRAQRTLYEKERFMIAPADVAAEKQADTAWVAQLEALQRKLLHPLQTDKAAPAKVAIIKTELARMTAKSAPPPPTPPPADPKIAEVTKPIFPPIGTNTKPTPPPPLEEGSSRRLKPGVSVHPIARGTFNDETIKGADAMVTKLKMKNLTPAAEGEDILKKVISRDYNLLNDVKGVTLVSVNDAASPPMNHNSGEPAEIRGSWAPKVLAGTNREIMLWGPYETLESGSYLAVYRFKIRELRNAGVRVDVARDGQSHASISFKGSEKSINEWLNFGVPFEVAKKGMYEFRVWPNNNEVAVDRIYVYRFEIGASPGG